MAQIYLHICGLHPLLKRNYTLEDMYKYDNYIGNF
jgi:hypothetical protein